MNWWYRGELSYLPQTLTVKPLVVSSKSVTLTSKEETSISSSTLKYVDIYKREYCCSISRKNITNRPDDSL